MKNKLQNHLIMVTTMIFMAADLAFDGNFSKSFLLSLMLLFYAVCIIRPDELSQSDAQDSKKNKTPARSQGRGNDEQ